eukprot:GHVN01011386.1.p1 GENE.GHVN01011386.1~~GHVN01011386.1.p1  ORF type:complete len:103 (+),score=3.85 GHVN01011386.1:210-518(+)
MGLVWGRMTLTADLLTPLVQRAINALNTGHEYRIVCLDIERAYDGVWHEYRIARHRGLMKKLSACGVGGTSFVDGEYLADRSLTVCVNGVPPKVRAINAAVP